VGLDPEKSHAQRIAAMLSGHVITQLVASAVRFGIPDHLGDGAVTDVRLGELTGLGIGELRRFLRALEGLGLVEPVGANEYRGTALVDPLRRDTGGLHGQALMAGAEYYEAWSELDHALRTGESAFEHRHGRSLWSLFDDDGEVAASFARTMRWNTEHFLGEILDLYDFPATGVVADLGAGDGTLVSALLMRFPELRGIAFEQPAVIDHTRRTVEEHGLVDRCELVTGNFLDEVPKGADLYLLKAVVHNWDDEPAVRILRNCRAAVGERGRLLVIENAMRADDVLGAAIRDLTMLVLFGGRDRTVDEYCSLVELAGFAVDRTVRGETGICLLEARPEESLA
jgi:hypothetical protein